MTQTLANFDGFPDGTVVTAGGTGNSDDNGDTQIPAAIFVVAGGAITYTTLASHSDSSAIRVLCNSTANAAYFGYTADPAPDVAFREQFYVYLRSYPTASMRFWTQTTTGASTLARMQLSTAGVLSLVMTATSTAATALALNTLYRVDVTGSGGNSAAAAVTVNVYAGDTTGTTFTTMALTAQTTTGLWGRFLHGNCTGVNVGACDMIFDDVRTEIGTSSTPFAPYPVTVAKAASDSQVLNDASSLTQVTTITSTDTQTLSDVSNLTTSGSFAVNDVQTLQEVSSVLDISDLGTDDSVLGDSVTRSIRVGGSSYLWAGEADGSYFIGTTAQLAGLSVGDPVMHFNNTGSLQENTLFRITAFSADASGFTNIYVTPNRTVAAVNGDQLSEVVPAGASVAQSSGLSDSATQSDSSSLSTSVGLSVTDSATQNDLSSISTTLATTDSSTLSETSNLVQATGISTTDSATQSDSSSLVMASTVTASDASTLTDASDTTRLTQTFGVDSLTQLDTSSLLSTDDGIADGGTQVEGTSVVDVSLSLTDVATQSDTSAMLSFTNIAVTDAFSLNESSSTGGNASMGVSDAFTFTEQSSVSATVGASDNATQGDSTQLDRPVVDAAVQSDVSVLAQDTQTADSATQSDVSGLNVSLSVTDASTLADAATLDSGTFITTSDSAAQSDSSALFVVFAVTDIAVQSDATQTSAVSVSAVDDWDLLESSMLSAGGNTGVTDSSGLDETSTVTTSGSSSDAATQSDASLLALTSAVNDIFTTTELSSISSAITTSDSAVLSEASGLNTGSTIGVTDGFVVGEAAALTIITNIVASDSATQTDASNPVGGSIAVLDLATLSETSSYGAILGTGDVAHQMDVSDLYIPGEVDFDRSWLDLQRYLTHMYILEAPATIFLTPYAKVRQGSGGFKLTAGTPRVAQQMRIIESSSDVGFSPARTENGFETERQYQLMCEYNAEIEVNDRFTFDNHDWQIIAFMPENGYEKRAVVRRFGD